MTSMKAMTVRKSIERDFMGWDEVVGGRMEEMVFRF